MGLSGVAECEIGLQAPRPMFQRVENTACVAFLQAPAKLIGHANIEVQLVFAL
jgi:hypothetical protein